MKPAFNFIIEHVLCEGTHYLKFIPSIKCPGYDEKLVEVSENQWNELKYHFMMAYEDKQKIERLAYLP